MPFTYELPLPTLPDGSSDRSAKVEKWLVREQAQLHPGSAVAVIVASGIRYEVRANGDGILRTRLVRKGQTISPSTSLAIIGADGEKIPYGKPYSVAHRLKDTGRHGRRTSRWLRSWRVVKRILKTPLYPMTSPKGMRQDFIARPILYGTIFVVSLYFEVPVLWWFIVGAIVGGVLIAIATLRFRDREQQ